MTINSVSDRPPYPEASWRLTTSATPANAAKIAGVTDLKGKKVATVRMASGDAVLRGALKDKGINWKTDLQIFELKSPAAVIEAVKAWCTVGEITQALEKVFGRFRE